ncbi:MAG: glycosyltransferase family 4 protein [Trichlorobacter sp.]|uniref:glycosyltransferase family 4 protein n=1 Tax=Trichlorobacter sp. TaxID=2911007 RepID=UPI0025692ACF|nr:glycosyltransferase family 4 protein [Trichlorobacter sp.]MDK9718579.1 glycosyltransferase family 4 protein [Trichlorobacter sp.]
MSEKPLRILMIAPTPYFSDRGCHVRIYEEARALMALGHQVRIVCYHLGRNLEPVPVERTLAIPWYSKHEAGPSWHKPYLDLLLLCTSLRVARQCKPDLIHAHLHEGVLIGWVVAKLRRIPLLFDYQGSLSGESLNHGFFGTGSLLHRLFRWIENRINRLADLIITSSTPGRHELLRLWQLPQQKVVALPDGVDTSVFRYFPRATARERLGIDDQVPVIVYLGLFNQYQGVDLLIHAARLMIQQGRNFHLLLMGYPEQEYRQLVDELNMNSFVTFTGRVNYAEAPMMLAAADLAVSPKISDTEANGKLLNYMACGLPVVAFDAPVNWELLGDDGIYAAFGDVVDLARCLSSALADREALRQRGKRLRLRAVEQLAWDVRVKELEAVYQQLLVVEK